MLNVLNILKSVVFTMKSELPLTPGGAGGGEESFHTTVGGAGGAPNSRGGGAELEILH